MPLEANRRVALSKRDKQGGPYRAASRLEAAEEVFTNEDGSTGTLYLVASDLTLRYDRMTKLYKKRWGIECYHKSLKQNAGLEESPTRSETTQRNHFFARLRA